MDWIMDCGLIFGLTRRWVTTISNHKLACIVASYPLFRRRKKGLVHIACACAGVSIVTGRVTMVIACGFCMTCSSMDDKRRVVSDSPSFFWGPPAWRRMRLQCVRVPWPRPFLLLKGLGMRLHAPLLGKLELGRAEAA